MSSSRPLYILGAGGLAREMAQLAEEVSRHLEHPWDLRGFIGTQADEMGRDLGYARVVGDDDWLLGTKQDVDVVLGVGNPSARAALAKRFRGEPDQFRFPNLLHPSALVDLDHVKLGQGNCVTAGCILTTDIEIGDFNLFNLHTTVGHDVRIGSSNVINPSVNVSGGVRMDSSILVGTGAKILENLQIGDHAIVGAGAVVTRAVPAGLTVVGVPARPLQR